MSQAVSFILAWMLAELLGVSLALAWIALARPMPATLGYERMAA
jgi:hypothetical protein